MANPEQTRASAPTLLYRLLIAWGASSATRPAVAANAPGMFLLELAVFESSDWTMEGELA